MDFKLIIKSIVSGLIGLFKMFLPIIYLILLLIFIIVLVYILCILYYRIFKKMKFKKSQFPGEKEKEPSLLKKIFFLFPKQLAYDTINKDPDEFNEFGIHIVVGEQGSGKSMTAIYLLEMWRKKYPLMQCYTNMGYKYEDDELTHWKELIERKNGKYGIANVIDDLKAWWSNKDSKDLPPEVLAELCQQRKQRKAIIGTIQVFSEAPKPIRSQTHYVYVPITVAGCLTIVRKTKAKYYDSENDRFKRYCGFFIFVHNKRLRNAYDTYKKIEKYKDTEFATPEWFKSE